MLCSWRQLPNVQLHLIFICVFFPPLWSSPLCCRKTWLLLHDPSHFYCFSNPAAYGLYRTENSPNFYFLNMNFWSEYLPSPLNSIQSLVMPRGGLPIIWGCKYGRGISRNNQLRNHSNVPSHKPYIKFVPSNTPQTSLPLKCFWGWQG